MKTDPIKPLSFLEVPVASILDDPCLIELTALHWDEIAKDKKTMRLNVDREHYLRSEAHGTLICVAAKAEERLVGYFLMWLNPHPHYKHVLTAQSDVYFLLPEYRSGANGFNLLQAGLSVAKRRGAGYAFVGTKIGHDHPKIMEGLGLKPRDLIYGGPL